jgi:hypothetical protein
MIRERETIEGGPVTAPVEGAAVPTDEQIRAEFRTAERLSDDRCPPEKITDRPSIGELIKELRDETTTLLRQEVALAKAEMNEKAAKLGRNAGYLGAGGVLAHAGALVLLLGVAALLYHGLVAAGLSHMVSGWLAPLIVGAVVGVIGYAMAQKAISTFKHESLVPEKTLESLKENQQWLQRKATA